MNHFTRYAVLTVSLGLLGACTNTARQAPVVDRPVVSRPQPLRPVTPAAPAEETRTDARGSYTVRRGDRARASVR